jgi:3-oxoacyl-[acyl-carrier protein] reductase
MNLGLRGKVAIVTGSSRGIGRAIALSLAGEGAQVVLSARGAEDLQSAVAEARGVGGSDAAAEGVVADLTTEAGVEAVVAAATRRFGRLDIVVNNVGGSAARDFASADVADFRAVLDRNFFPALRVSRAALPHLEVQGGVIVMIASIYGREAGGGPSYNVAKAAEISLAKAMARDLAAKNIRVLSIAPGSVLFPGGGWDRRQKADPDGIASFVAREIPGGRFGRPDEIADVVAFACSPRASWLTGVCIPVDGGQSRAF